MRITTLRTGWLVLCVGLIGLLVGCSGGGSEPGGPGAAVEAFYQALNQGDYAAARTMYQEAVQAELGDPEISTDDGFRQWAQAQTKRGSVSQVKIIDSVVDDKTAKVQFEIRYSDGSTRQGAVELAQEDDGWKLGYVS